MMRIAVYNRIILVVPERGFLIGTDNINRETRNGDPLLIKVQRIAVIYNYGDLTIRDLISDTVRVCPGGGTHSLQVNPRILDLKRSSLKGIIAAHPLRIHVQIRIVIRTCTIQINEEVRRRRFRFLTEVRQIEYDHQYCEYNAQSFAKRSGSHINH